MQQLIPCSLLTVALLAAASSAQDSIHSGRRHIGDPSSSQGVGELFVTPNPRNIPRSLQHLVDLSTLIIEGTVQATIPPQGLDPTAFETDAVIDITRTLKGSAPDRQILVAQRGGTNGKMGAIPMQYAIMQPAERYLLFLTDYQGVAPADPAGKKRHLVTGVWSGLFLFENGRMRVNPSRPDALRQAYEGLTVEQVAKQIQDLQKP